MDAVNPSHTQIVRKQTLLFSSKNACLPWLTAVEVIGFSSSLWTAWSAKKVSSRRSERTAWSQGEVDPLMEMKPNIKKSLRGGLAVAQGFRLKINKISTPAPNTPTKEIVHLSNTISLRKRILITKSSFSQPVPGMQCLLHLTCHHSSLWVFQPAFISEQPTQPLSQAHNCQGTVMIWLCSTW